MSRPRSSTASSSSSSSHTRQDSSRSYYASNPQTLLTPSSPISSTSIAIPIPSSTPGGLGAAAATDNDDDDEPLPSFTSKSWKSAHSLDTIRPGRINKFDSASPSNSSDSDNDSDAERTASAAPSLTVSPPSPAIPSTTFHNVQSTFLPVPQGGRRRSHSNASSVSLHLQPDLPKFIPAPIRDWLLDHPIVTAGIKAGLLFVVAVGSLWLLLHTMLPDLDEGDKEHVKLPKSFEELKALNEVLQVSRLLSIKIGIIGEYSVAMSLFTFFMLAVLVPVFLRRRWKKDLEQAALDDTAATGPLLPSSVPDVTLTPPSNHVERLYSDDEADDAASIIGHASSFEIGSEDEDDEPAVKGKGRQEAGRISMEQPIWPPLCLNDPLRAFHSALPSILTTANHSQIWGIQLTQSDPPAFTTLLVLQKYLRSNNGEVEVAKKKLAATLAWRKEFGLDGAEEGPREVEDDRFTGLGYVTRVSRDGVERVVTWNVYGAVKKPEETFSDIERFLSRCHRNLFTLTDISLLRRFLRWRVNLMERGVRALSLSTATTPLSSSPNDPDPYQMVQVHDYLGVSFLRLDPATKAATKKTIEVLSAHYPELLEQKFFVNVPWVMGWVYAAIKMVVRKETVEKFVVLADGKELAKCLGSLEDVPIAYGGTGVDLKDAEILEKKTAGTGDPKRSVQVAGLRGEMGEDVAKPTLAGSGSNEAGATVSE
ncbi:phosphatidylinositol transfer protein SFH5, partial [Phenoliferia sp. Uapishka_3]